MGFFTININYFFITNILSNRDVNSIFVPLNKCLKHWQLSLNTLCQFWKSKKSVKFSKFHLGKITSFQEQSTTPKVTHSN